MVGLSAAVLALWALSAQGQSDKQRINTEVSAVWKQFLAACAQGDLDAALAFVHPQSRLVPELRNISAEGLKKLAAAHVAIELNEAVGPFAECKVETRQADGTHRFYMARLVRSGQSWLIEEF
ncbi:MAG: hypothetical protein V4582_25490 [Pseudomonadota bacterium]